MSEPIQNTPPDLIKIKIAHLIRFAHSFQGIEVHVFINGKFVKMNYGNEPFIEILQRLQEKKVDEVYINQVDCKRIMQEVQNGLTAKSFNDPKKTDEQRMERAENSLEIMKSFVTQMSISKESLDIMLSINKNTLPLLMQSTTLMEWIKRFKNTCSEEFLKSILTSYLCIRVIDSFPWASTSIKEKTCLASLLCDITLTAADFKDLKEHELHGAAISDKIKNHPKEIIKILGQKKDVISSETLMIIEQHHEKPDGSGFPHGIDVSRFNQLSTIFIVSQKFIEYLMAENFNYEKKKSILEKIYQTYNGKTFDKTIANLVSVVK